MNKQLLKTSGADVLSSMKKLKKNPGGGIHPLPSHLYVRGVNGPVKLFWFTSKISDNLCFWATEPGFL